MKDRKRSSSLFLDQTPELRPAAMETLSSIVAQLGKKYAIFVPMVQKVLIKHKINHQSYDLLCARITEGGPMLDGVDGGQGYLSRHSRSRRRPGTGGSGANQVSRHKSFRALLLVFLFFFVYL